MQWLSVCVMTVNVCISVHSVGVMSLLIHWSCVASFSGPTFQMIRKAGGEPGTSWHVTDSKLRQVDKTARWHSCCET